MKQDVKILIHTGPFYPSVGGKERFAEDIATGLTHFGLNVAISTLTPGDSRGDATRFPFRVARVRGKLDLAKEMLRSDLVIFVGFMTYDVALATLLRRKILLTHHGVYVQPGDERKITFGAIKCWLARFFNNVSVSRFIASQIKKSHKVIHNPYQDSIFFDKGSARKPGSFAFVGRLVDEKGVFLLLQAFADVRSKFSFATLKVIGDGPSMASLQHAAAHLECSDSVSFEGMQSANRIAEMLNETECLVVPSLCLEAFGIVALEGLASGCEVIVAERGGLREAIGSLGRVCLPERAHLSAMMLDVISGRKLRVEPDASEFLVQRTRSAISAEYLREIRRLLCIP